MFEELWKSIQVHYAAKRYHLVLGNIQVLIPLFNQQLLGDRPALESTLNQLQDMLVQLDTLAAEFHFRDYLHRYFIQPIYQQIKLFDETLAESFLQTLMKRIPRSDRGKIRYAKYEHSFQTFYNLEDKDPDKQLRLARGQRIALLEADIADNQYGVWSDMVLSYLNAQLCAGQGMNAIQLKAVLNCLDALLTRINTANLSEVMVEELWREVLIAQRLLSNHLAQASIGEDLSCEVLSNWWQVHQSQAAGLFLLFVIAQAIALHKEVKCDAWYALAQQINSQLMTYVPLNLTTAFTNHLVELQTMRDVFKKLPPAFSLMTPQALVKAQQQFTHDTLNLLNQFVQMVASLLGDAPCDFALCALGSTSREDRRPYSDVELVLLYKPKPHVNAAQLQTYLYYLVCGIELAIKQCGESHQENADPTLLQSAGFHLDDSSHLLKKKLMGTPEEIVHKFIVNIAQSWEDEGHPWLNDESFYSLLSPVLINSDSYGGEQVLSDYKTLIQSYLTKTISKEDQLQTLIQSLNLTVALSFNGSKRREVIALSCLYDVAQKSKALLTALKPGEIVDDIKRAFYKPLTYLALNLKLAYGLNARHPAQIFAEAAAQLSWGQSLVGQLLQTALTYITAIQIKLHLQHGHQEERIIWLGHSITNSEVSYLNPEEYAGLSLIKDGLLLPLCQWLEQRLNQNKHFALSELLPFLLKSYLTQRSELWLSQWSKHPSHSLKFNELLAHPLMSVLVDYPSPNGWSPAYEQSMRRWLGQLQTLVNERKSACLIEGIPTVQQKASYLPQEIVAQLFNAKGEFKGNLHHSAQSKVSQITWPVPGQEKPTTFYFKVKPGNEAGLMGREFAVINLHQLLGGQSHLALGWPLKLTYLTSKGTKVYYCWVSEEVPGSSLSEVMQNQPAFELINAMLDKQSYSHLFITHYLTCPEDAQPDNFKVNPTPEGTFKLYGLDVGQSFVGTYDEKRKVLSVKTMLYLLEPAMHQALDAQVLTWLMLVEPIALIKHWRANIKQMNQLFQPLFEAELTETRIPKTQWCLHNQLIDVHEAVQLSVQKRLDLLINWLYRNYKNEKSGAVLLKALDPAVALSYQSLQGKIKTPEDFYKIDPKAYVKNPNTGKMYSSTTYLQVQQQSLTPERLQMSLNLGEEYFANLDFRNIQEEQEQRYVLALLQAAIKNKKSFSYLNLSGCTVISEKELIELLQKTPNLKELYLEDCPQFSLVTVFNLLRTKVNERLVGFTWEFEVLCPSLKILHFTIENKQQTLTLPTTLGSRKQILDFALTWYQQFNRYWNKVLAGINHSAWYFRSSAFESLEQLVPKLMIAQSTVLFEKLWSLGNKNLFSKKRVIECLAAWAPILSIEQITMLFEKLLPLIADTDRDFRASAAHSLLQLAPKLSEAQIVELAAQFLIFLKKKERKEFERYGIRDSFIKLLAPRLPAKQASELAEELLLLFKHNDFSEGLDAYRCLVAVLPKLSATQANGLAEQLLSVMHELNSKELRALSQQALKELALGLSEAQASFLTEKQLHLLQEGKCQVRLAASQSLLALVSNQPQAQVNLIVEQLLPRLKDDNHEVRHTVPLIINELLPKLSQMQIDILFEQQLPGLNDENWEARESTRNCLNKLVPKLSNAQINTLAEQQLQKLKNTNALIRSITYQSLKIIAPKLSEPHIRILTEQLLHKLKEEDATICEVIQQNLNILILLLPEIQVSDVFEQLLPLLKDENDHVREAACHSLGKLALKLEMQSNKLFEQLQPLLKDENWSVQDAAFQSLNVLAPKLSETQIDILAEHLFAVLKNNFKCVGFNSYQTLPILIPRLSESQINKLVEHLPLLLKHNMQRIRADEACKILEFLASKLSEKPIDILIEQLMPLLIDEISQIREAVCFIFLKLTPRLSDIQVIGLVTYLVMWSKETEKSIGYAAASSLFMLMPSFSKVHMGALVDQLKSLIKSTEFIRGNLFLFQVTAKSCFAQVGVLVDKLLLWLNDESLYVRTYAIGGLDDLAPKMSAEQASQVMEKLLSLMSDKDLSVRGKVIESLAVFYSPNIQLTVLRHAILKSCENTVTLQSTGTQPINRAITQKIFSFLDEKTLSTIIPCVSKDWRRWHRGYQHQQAEQRRVEHSLIVSDTDTKKDEETADAHFKRFLP